MYFVLGPEMEILWFGTPDAVKKVSFYLFPYLVFFFPQRWCKTKIKFRECLYFEESVIMRICFLLR